MQLLCLTSSSRKLKSKIIFLVISLKNTHFNQSCATIHDWVFLVEMSEISLFYHRKMGLFWLEVLFLLKCHKLGEMDHEWNICLEADEISFRRELVNSILGTPLGPKSKGGWSWNFALGLLWDETITICILFWRSQQAALNRVKCIVSQQAALNLL